MNTLPVCASALVLAAVACTSALSAQLGAGDGQSPETAVRVLSAESEADLYETVSAWVVKHEPRAQIAQREFRFLADDRALLVIWALVDAGPRQAFYFETPGLPFQFVGKHK
jgi:hypothetical protein